MNKDLDFLLGDEPVLPDVKSICLSCGFEETIPDFIYDEMGGKKTERIKNKTKSINYLL